MKKFELVRDLVKSLNEGESRLIEKFLVSFDDVKNSDSLKILRLFKELREIDNSVPEEEVMLVISPDYKPESFSRLVSRLKDKIYDTLTLDANVFRKDTYSELYQKKYYLRKLTSVASIVHGRGNVPLAMELYEKIIVGCKEFEIYSELIETLLIVQQMKGISEGIETYLNLQEQILFYEKCLREYNRAKHYIYELSSNQGYETNSQENITILESKVLEVENALSETNSVSIEYFLRYLQIQLAQWRCDYELAIRYNYQLVDLVKSNKAIYLKRSYANTLNELANNLLLGEKFIEVADVTEKVFELIPENSLNTALGKDVRFLSFLYLKDLESATSVVDDLLNNKYYNPTDFLRSRRVFYKANLAFFKRDFSLVHQLLQDVRELENDREGWNYAIRILSIINDIERGLYDIADNKIESLRKFISRAKNPPSERFLIEQKLLAQLVKNSFDFRKTYLANESLLKQLRNDNYWRVRTAELFPFEDWFMSKIEEISYEFRLPVLFSREIKRDLKA